MSCHTYAVGKAGVIVHNGCSGSYELDFSDGKKYIGKGKKKRMWTSIKRIEREHKVKCINHDFKEAATSREGFVQEYLRMRDTKFDPLKNGFNCKNKADIQFYNKINSPGLKIWLGLK